MEGQLVLQGQRCIGFFSMQYNMRVYAYPLFKQINLSESLLNVLNVDMKDIPVRLLQSSRSGKGTSALHAFLHFFEFILNSVSVNFCKTVSDGFYQSRCQCIT